MVSGVLGGLVSPRLRRWVSRIVSPVEETNEDGVLSIKQVAVDGEGIVPVRPMAVEVLGATCYLGSAALLFVPYFCADSSPNSFTLSLAAFLAYELMIGVFLPCEGVIRSLYFPSNARASIMALPRVVVNGAVAFGVLSTNYIRYVRASSLPTPEERLSAPHSRALLLPCCYSFQNCVWGSRQFDGHCRSFAAFTCFSTRVVKPLLSSK